MFKFIEDFYYGNIEPQESSSEIKAELKRKLSILTQTEEQLTAKINNEEKELFAKYASQFSGFLRMQIYCRLRTQSKIHLRCFLIITGKDEYYIQSSQILSNITPLLLPE